MFKKVLLSSVCASALMVSNLSAADLFSVEGSVGGGPTYYKGSSTLQGLLDSIGTTTNIQSYLTGYTNASAASLVANYRGVAINFSYGASSNTLIMSIPAIGVNESFAGTSRENSQDLLSDWFKSNGATSVEKLMKKLAEVSPTDPIAGNPNSVMSQSVATSFNYGFTDVIKNKGYSGSASTQKTNSMALAASYMSMKQDGLTSNKYSLPLSYSIVSDSNPDRRYNIMVPIGMTDVAGAKAVDLGLGFSANLPVTTNWTLTPSVLYGATASIDMGSLGQVGTASLTSAYKIKAPGGQLGIGNMAGYTRTLKLYNGEYAYDPGIRNTVLKNGLIYDIDTSSFLSNTSLDVFATNTAFSGTKLYVNNYNEFGFSYGFSKVKQVIPDGLSLTDKVVAKTIEKISQLRVGATYLTSAKSKGFQINFGYVF